MPGEITNIFTITPYNTSGRYLQPGTNNSFNYNLNLQPTIWAEFQSSNLNIFNNNLTNPPIFNLNFKPTWQQFDFFAFNTKPVWQQSNSFGLTTKPLTYTNNSGSNVGQRILDEARKYDGYSASEMSKIMNDHNYQYDEGKWCADFCSFVLGRAVGEDNLPEWYKNCGKGGRGRASVPKVEMAARQNGAIVAEKQKGKNIDISDVKPGDLVVFDWNDDGNVDHIGIVEKVENGKVYTIEGNVSNKVGRRSNRQLSTIHSFIRIS